MSVIYNFLQLNGCFLGSKFILEVGPPGSSISANTMEADSEKSKWGGCFYIVLLHLTIVNLSPLTNNTGMVSLIAHRYKDTDLKVMVTPWSNNASSLEQVQKHGADNKTYALQPGQTTQYRAQWGRQRTWNEQINTCPESTIGHWFLLVPSNIL